LKGEGCPKGETTKLFRHRGIQNVTKFCAAGYDLLGVHQKYRGTCPKAKKQEKISPIGNTLPTFKKKEQPAHKGKSRRRTTDKRKKEEEGPSSWRER